MPQQAKTGSGGGGLTALLLFLVMGAFGLMIMLFVATTTHAPVIMGPPAPVQVRPMQPMTTPDGSVSDDGQPGYVRRWDDNGHPRVVPPQPPPYFYQVRPHVVYPPLPNPPPRDDDRDSHH